MGILRKFYISWGKKKVHQRGYGTRLRPLGHLQMAVPHICSHTIMGERWPGRDKGKSGPCFVGRERKRAQRTELWMPPNPAPASHEQR